MFFRFAFLFFTIFPTLAFAGTAIIGGKTYVYGELSHKGEQFFMCKDPSICSYKSVPVPDPKVSGNFVVVTQFLYENNPWTCYSCCVFDILYFPIISIDNVPYVPDPDPNPVDTDGDGLNDVDDPCPDTPDTNLSVYRAKNSQTGSYYFFQITGDCGKTISYMNPIYASWDEMIEAAKQEPDPFAVDTVSMNPQDFQKWKDSLTGDKPIGSESLPGTNPFSPDPTGPNTPSPLPPVPESSDPDTQKVIQEIERLKSSITRDVKESSSKITNQIETSTNKIVGALKGVGGSGASMVGVENKLSTTNSKLGAIEGAISSGNEDIVGALGDIKEAVENIKVGSGSGGGNGTGEDESGPDLSGFPEFEVGETNSSFGKVEEEKITAAKQSFESSVNTLKASVTGILNANLSGSSSLPVWNWSILGHNITIDINQFASTLNYVGIALILCASISAIFIVFG
ncbi:hypothetical protein MASR1M90_23760 [Desulfovibrionales bacterium]